MVEKSTLFGSIRDLKDKNIGIVNALQEQLGHTIHTSPLTQYNGALGAALFAYQKYLKEQKG